MSDRSDAPTPDEYRAMKAKQGHYLEVRPHRVDPDTIPRLLDPDTLPRLQSYCDSLLVQNQSLIEQRDRLVATRYTDEEVAGVLQRVNELENQLAALRAEVAQLKAEKQALLDRIAIVGSYIKIG